MESSDNIRGTQTASDSIDFGKLKIILRSSWPWILLIFIIINSAAFLFIRYTKNLYESDSEIKLDIKSEASEFGMKNVLEDQSLNIVSGEIEIIQSRLFINRVLDRSAFDVNFISVGRVLNDEMFLNAPATVKPLTKKHSHYNVPINFTEIDARHFSLRVGDKGKEVTGVYGKQIAIDDLNLILERNKYFRKGDEVGYFFIINSREVLLNYILSNLIVEPLNYSANTIRISFKDHNAFKAQAVLNKIDTIYLHYSNEQKNLVNKQKIDWLTNELGHIEARMEAYENYFEDFTLKNKTNNLDNDLKKTIEALNQVDSQRYEYTRKVKETDRLIDGLNSGNLIIPASIRSSLSALLNKNLELLLQLQLEQEKLKLSYNEITFAFREKDKEIEILKRKTTEQLTELQSDWKKKLTEINQRKIYLENEFADFPDKNTQFSKNQRFYKLYEEFYLTLMQSKSQFEIAQAGTIPDFKILSPASFTGNPISPNRLMIAGIGLVMSIVLNLFFIGILYLANNKITSLSELEKIISAPVLGSIPVSKYSNETGLHILDYPKSMVSEAMRSLRTNLDFFNASSNQKVIAISSTVSGEGKSFIAMNLGGILALSKKKVILIDLDMRKPKINQPAESIDSTKGVSTILIRKHSWSDCVVKTRLENFDFIPAGPHPPNPSELLLNGEFAELITSLKQKYDFIILDTPPVGLVTDGIMAMRRADISIYVFRANYSKREFLSNMQRVININKFSNITTILNAVPTSGKTYGHNYYEESKRPGKLKSLLQI